MTQNDQTKNPIPDLANPDTLKEIQADVAEICLYNQFPEAYQYAKLLEEYLQFNPSLNIQAPSLFAQYQALLLKLRWVGLPIFQEATMVNMFRKHFSVIYEIPDYDVWDQLIKRLVSLATLEARDALKKQILEALRENQETITQETITKDGRQIAGSVKNWLLDSVISLGLDRIDAVRLTDYLVSSQNTKHLSKESRQKIHTLLNLVENLKKSSVTPEGFEATVPVEELGLFGVIRQGVFEKYGDDFEKTKKSLDVIRQELDKVHTKNKQTAGQNTPPAGQVVTPTDPGHHHQLGVENLLKIYSQNPDEQKAIYEEEKTILKRVGQEQFNVRPEFEEAVRSNNRNRVIAFLHVLAKTQDLAMVMKTDSAFRDLLKEKYGPESLTQFDAQPGDPIFYSLWLQYLLKQRLQMLESDSARIGAKLANLLGRKYLKVAYIDSVTGSFKWVPVKKEKNRLMLVQ